MRKWTFWLFSLFILFAATLLVLLHLGNQVVRISGHPVEHELMIYGGITRAQLADTEILCSGHFAPESGGTSTVDMTINSYTYRGVVRNIHPFHIDHYWKGSGPSALDVARFNAPPLIVDYFDTYDSGNNRRFLLALKKDTTGSSAYQLVDIMNSWLSLPNNALENITTSSPEKIIESACVDALKSYATYTPPAESPGQYSLETGQFEMLYQALDTLKTFGTSDEKTIQALEAIYTNPNLSSAIMVAHNYAFEALNKINPTEASKFGMGLYDAGSLNDYDRERFISEIFQNDPMQSYQLAVKLDASGSLSEKDRLFFARNLGRVIKVETYSQLDPAFIEKMIEGDDVAEHQACDAFSQMRGDPRAVAWLGKSLYSSDPTIQFRAMNGLSSYFAQSEKTEKALPRPDSRQIDRHMGPDHHPDVPLPEEIVGPYKTRVKTWIEQHSEYALP
jgi:hypothetical protein